MAPANETVAHLPFDSSRPFLTIQEVRVRPHGVSRWDVLGPNPDNLPVHGFPPTRKCTFDITLSIEGGYALQNYINNGGWINVGAYICIARDPELLSAISKDVAKMPPFAPVGDYTSYGSTFTRSLWRLIADSAPAQGASQTGTFAGPAVHDRVLYSPPPGPWFDFPDGLHVYQVNVMTYLRAANFSIALVDGENLLIKGNTSRAAYPNQVVPILAKTIPVTINNVDIPAFSQHQLPRGGLHLMAASWTWANGHSWGSQGFKVHNIAKQTLLKPVGKVPLTLQSYNLVETQASYGAAENIWPGSVHEFDNQKYSDKARELGVITTADTFLDVANEHGTTTKGSPVLLTGNRHLPNPMYGQKLESTTVPNIKIIDSRMLNYLQARQGQILNRTWPRLLENIYDASPVVAPTPSTGVYLSALEVSQMGSSDVINGMFSFDAAKFMADNNRVGNIITNPESLANALDLQDIEIYQKLVGPSVSGNKLTPGKPRSCGLAAAAPSFKKVASLQNGCHVLSGMAGRPVLDIVFRDMEASQLASGNLEYMVKISVSDQTTEILRELLRVMRSDLRVVEAARTTDAVAGTCSTLPIEYPRLIQRYLGALLYLAGPEIFVPWGADYINTALMATIYSSCNGRYGVVDLISLFISSLEAIVSPSGNLATEGTDANLASRLMSTISDPMLRIEKVFTEKAILGTTSDDPNTTDTPILVGYGPHMEEIMNVDTATPRSWATLKYAKYQNIVSKMEQVYPETWYTAIGTVDAPFRNPYGYLSPLFIYTQTPTGYEPTYSPIYWSSVDLAGETAGIGHLADYNALIASSLNPDNSQNSGVVMNSSPSQAQMDLLRFAGIGIQRLHTSPADSVGLQTTGDPITVEDLLSPESAQVNASTGYDPSQGNEDPIDNIDDTAAALAQGPLVHDLVNGVASHEISDDPWIYPSFLRGSVMQRYSGYWGNNQFHINPDSDYRYGWCPECPLDPFELKLKYGSIAQVQYLAQYDDTTGLGQQNWQLLNTDTFEDARDNNRTLMCRLVFVGGPVTSNISVRPLGTLFIISPTNDIPTTAYMGSSPSQTSAVAIVENMSLTDNTAIGALISSFDSTVNIISPAGALQDVPTKTALWYAQDIPSIDNVTALEVASEAKVIIDDRRGDDNFVGNEEGGFDTAVLNYETSVHPRAWGQRK